MKTIVLFFLFVTFVKAQTTSDSISISDKYALQFQISENFKLTSLQGTIFSGKYHFNNSYAIRLGISGTVNNSTRELVVTNNNSEFREQSLKSVELKLQLLYLSPIISDVSFFIGTGPFIGLSSSELSREISDNTYESSRIKDLSKVSSTAYGLEFVIGTEWFVKNNISLSAEYGLNISQRDENRNNEINDNGNENTGEEKLQYDLITPTSVKLGLSIYF